MSRVWWYLWVVRYAGRVVLGAAVALGAVACVFLVVVVAGQGVVKASSWAGVLVAPIGVVAAVAAIWPLAAHPSRELRGESAPALGLPAPVPRRWFWISLGLFGVAVLALILRAGSLALSVPRLTADLVAAVSGLTGCLAFAVHRRSVRRQPMPLPDSVRTLLERQRELSQHHQYPYWAGSAPPVLEIYVDQQAEWRRPASIAGSADTVVPLTLPQMLSVSRNTLMLADPGVGKSTAIAQVIWQQSAWWLAARRSSKPRNAPYGPVIPLLLPPDLHKCDSLPAAMARQWEQLTGGRADARAFEGKPPCAESWLVLIDGIDQVLSTPDRTDLLARAGAWVAEQSSACRFLITSRPLLSGELGPLKAEHVGRFMLRRFDEEGLYRFVSRWAAFRESQHFAEVDIHPITVDEFMAAIKSSSLSSLAQIPLIATITALILESDRETALPTSRAGLYERFVLQLVSSGRMERLRTDIPPQFASCGKSGQRAWTWLLENIRDLLEGAADLHLSVGSPGVSECARKWSASNAPAGLLARVPGWEDALKGLLTATSLIAPGPQGLHFIHPNFAEYLAAGPRGRIFDLETWLADARSPDSRSLALFVLARQPDAVGAQPGPRLPDTLAELLLERGGAEACIAGAIIADGIEVTAALRHRVVDDLFEQLKQDETDTSAALAALISLSAHKDVLHRLAQFAGDPAHPDWVRADAAQELCPISRDTGIRLLREVLDSTSDLLLQDRILVRLEAYGAVRPGERTAGPGPTDTRQGTTSPGLRAGHWYRQIAEDTSNDSGQRLRALLAMAERHDPGWSSLLTGIIADSALHQETRLDAARRLIRLGEPTGTEAIRRIAEQADLQLEVRVPLLAALAETQDEYARQMLIRLDTADGGRFRERFPAVAAWREEIGTRSSEQRSELAADPAIWGDVPRRSRNFTGRDEHLAQLRRGETGRVTAIVPAEALPQVMAGLGGIGKTAIAIEYAHRYRRNYDLVWWIPSEQPELVRSALASLAAHLGLETAAPTGIDDAVEVVLDALRRGQPYSRWLLIYDNAEQPEELGKFIPHGPGDVLITSRNHGWQEVCDAAEVGVEVFTRAESRAFLSRRTAGGITESDTDRLAEALGDLPVALEQAGAMLAETGMPAGEYLELLGEQTTLIMAEGKPSELRAVTATWELAVTGLQQQMPQAMQLLRCLAFFSPEPIPSDVFRLSAPVSGTRVDDLLADPILLGRAIRELSRFALVHIEGRLISVHRVVQRLLRDELSNEEQASYRHDVHLLLAAGGPVDPADERHWQRYGELLPHVTSPALDLARCQDPAVRAFALGTMRYLGLSGDFTSCRALAEGFIRQWTEDSGPDDPSVLDAQRHLGDALRQLGRYREAREVTEVALTRCRRVSGEDSVLTLALRTSYGGDLRTRGDFAAARAFDEETRDLHETVFGPAHPRTMHAMNDLALDYGLTSDYRKARELSQGVYILRSEAAAVTATDLLASWNNLAWAIRLCGNFTEARDVGEDAWEYGRERLGPEHYETLRAANALSITLRCITTSRNEALEIAGQVYGASGRLFGEYHPDTIAAAMNLSSLRRVTGQTGEALRLAGKTVTCCQDVYGPEHPYTYGCMGNFALLRRVSGDPGGARNLDEAALAGLDRQLTRGHHYSLTVASNLASDLAALGDFTGARALGEDTLSRSRRLLGEDHPMTLGCAANLALDLRADGAGDDAERLAADTMDRYARMLDADSTTAAAGRRLDFDFDPPPV